MTLTVARRLVDVRRAGPEESAAAGGGRLVAVLGRDYADSRTERVVDHVVVEHGTLPNDELYRELVAGSSNLGEVDHEALVAVAPQEVATNPDGRFQLFRIGDAVTSRNIHAAVYDALRLCITV